MSNQHTPGPWGVEQDDEGNLLVVPCAEAVQPVAQMLKGVADFDKRYDIDDKQLMVNARLIAAAPELLETLEAILPYLKAGEMIIAKAAIAKAKWQP